MQIAASMKNWFCPLFSFFFVGRRCRNRSRSGEATTNNWDREKKKEDTIHISRVHCLLRYLSWAPSHIDMGALFQVVPRTEVNPKQIAATSEMWNGMTGDVKKENKAHNNRKKKIGKKIQETTEKRQYNEFSVRISVPADILTGHEYHCILIGYTYYHITAT